MNRNALPGWVNRMIDRIADSPMSPVGRLAAKRLGTPAPIGSIPATAFAEKPVRLLIAPVNYAGQATAWARALEATDASVSARSMAIEVAGGFSFEADLEVPVSTYHNDPHWQQRQFLAAASATHVLIEAEEPPFGRMLGRSVEAQASALSSRGVKIGHMSHGTDARLPSRHAETSEWSYYRDPSVYLPRLESLARRNIDYLERSKTPIFVSTPDLLLDLPSAHWCPVVVDPTRWAVERSWPPQLPLRVAHAPSNPVLKGTPMILPVLEKLVAEGVISLRLITGVPSAQMPQTLKDADVLLDQFRLGSYGVAACEAMASGCVVVGQVSQQVRDAVHTFGGTELPIVEATPASLEAALRELATDGQLRQRSEQGVRFVHKVHDGAYSGRVLFERFVGA